MVREAVGGRREEPSEEMEDLEASGVLLRLPMILDIVVEGWGGKSGGRSAAEDGGGVAAFEGG